MIKLLKLAVSMFGGVDVSEENHVDTFTENRMKNVIGEKIAYSENGGIWIEFQELSEFNFMNIVVIGNSKFKTFKGCELVFFFENRTIKLKSDTLEIESDFSNVSDRWITEITFDVTNINLDFLINKEADKVEIVFEKKSESFYILK